MGRNVQILMVVYYKDNLKTKQHNNQTLRTQLSKLEKLLLESKSLLPSLYITSYTDAGNCNCGCGCKGVVGEATNWCYFLCISAMS